MSMQIVRPQIIIAAQSKIILISEQLMQYIEVTVNTPEELIDRRCEEMAVMGAEGFVIENENDFQAFLENNRQYWDYVDESLENSYAGVSRIKCYLINDDAGRAVADAIKNAYDDVAVTLTADEDWENSWRDNYQPIDVGDKLVVVPEWMDVPDSGRVPLRLDPGLIFGTGSHPTTRMCLTALQDYCGKGEKVLDLGCGSGILGIGALVLGSAECVGCDVDPKAPDVVMSNAALNGIYSDRMTAYAGDIITDAAVRRELGTGYDVVLANIVADVIIALSPLARGFMKKDGVFICSGIIDDRADEVRTVLERNGFEIVSHLSEEEWHCYVCR